MRMVFAVIISVALMLLAVFGRNGMDVQADSGILLDEIATITLPGGEHYNDVWGYADEDSGMYLAFIANRDSLSIVDVADPTQPVVVSTIELPYTPSSHHDMLVYGTTLYVVTESNGSFTVATPTGLQIIDFADPSNPNVTFWSGAFASAHTIYIDEAEALLYASGTDIGGLVIVDISDASAPEYLGRFGNPYVHEVYVRDGIAYASEILDGKLGIYDVSDPTNIVPIASVQTPNIATHSTWLTDDGQYILTADESPGGGIAVYTNPVVHPLGELKLVNIINIDGFSVHQIHVRGDYLIASWYGEGVIIFDLSDPTSEVIVLAQGDSSEFDSDYEGYGGAWGVWPYDPRGEYLYVSDMQRGLVIYRTNGLTLP